MSDKPAMTVEQAYQHCQNLASQHYENFPTASKLIRADLRPAVAAIYAFARIADDMADEGDVKAEVRIKQLDAWETLLERCTQQQLDHPVFLALGHAIKRFNLPVQCLHDLLTAFRMDCSIQHYATEQELLFYCQHSANPVGRLMLALHGTYDQQALYASDCICTALQLTNFWQDFSIDHSKGRCYLPEAWLSPHQLNAIQLIESPQAAHDIDAVLTHAVHFTEDLYQQGSALLTQLPWRLRLQISATLHGGMSILAATANNPKPLLERASLQRKDWLKMVWPIFYSTMMPKTYIKALKVKSV